MIISGAIIFVLFVSYLGSKGHRPRWIALGSTVMGAGSIVFLLPHILAEQYDYRAVGKVYLAVLLLIIKLYMLIFI